MTEVATPNILTIEHLSKSFGKNKVLHNISLAVKKGTVLGLMGENGAGKSTMMKCLFGIYSMDEGEIALDGRPINFKDPKDALENGVSMVHQELNQCLDRTILDNLFLGRYPTKAGLIVDERNMLSRAKALFASLHMDIDPKRVMRSMSVSERQMVEIAKAVSYNAKLIVLDEPTSSLTEREVRKLFAIVSELRSKGVSFIYISHKMDEIFKICDEVSVLRDGHMIMTKAVKETSMEELIKAMVGRSLDNRFPPVDNVPGETIFEVKRLSTRYAPILRDISISVKKGEIFGLYGLVGAGRTELLETIFGIRTIRTGDIFWKGEALHFKGPKDAIVYNFAYLTEERKISGLFPKKDLTFNTCIASLDKYMRGPALSDKAMRDSAQEEIRAMHTRCMGPEDNIMSLSGGNQQKVIIGKWLETTPDLLLLDEPTRGIDVGAKYEIYQLIINLAKQGKTCIVVSSEMPEILGITNRIAVMSNYRIAGVVETKKTSQEELLRLSAKYL